MFFIANLGLTYYDIQSSPAVAICALFQVPCSLCPHNQEHKLLSVDAICLCLFQDGVSKVERILGFPLIARCRQ